MQYQLANFILVPKVIKSAKSTVKMRSFYLLGMDYLESNIMRTDTELKHRVEIKTKQNFK